MQTIIHSRLKSDARAIRADQILRSCVHCGFCISACPTYQLLGDELDSPRGRIYLIKNMLEDDAIAEATSTHLDRCLTCRSCETVCPSGVEYVELLDIARAMIVERKGLDLLTRFKRWLVRKLLLKVWLTRISAVMIRLVHPLLPNSLGAQAALSRPYIVTPIQTLEDPVNPVARVLLLKGCVQQSLTPNVNAALTALLRQQGVACQFVKAEGCCGALEYHLGEHDYGKLRMKALIDAVYPLLEDLDYIVSSASGCGVTLKQYPAYFSEDRFPEDKAYAQKALAVSAKVVDVVELMDRFDWHCSADRVSVHTPCTLSHGQGLDHQVTALLEKAGASIQTVKGHLACCGSAGSYSVLQPLLADRLRDAMLEALGRSQPDFIVTSNIGCQLHLAVNSKVPVVHWLEYLYQHRI
ncbi:MAG: glycolate oxidase subunit GlcF [Pseudomonadales bacterium]|nr:glycolate oxidase subunit GlcF [Pseudomonadales bacterium]